MTFAEYLWELLPRAFKNPGVEVKKISDSLGVSLDEAKAALFALRLAWLVSSAPVDALEILAKDRLVSRYPGETDASFRNRVMAALDLHASGGTVPGMLAALAALGYADAEIFEYFATDPARWAEFEARINLPFPAALPEGDRDALLGIIQATKPAHAILADLVLSETWSEGMTWGDSLTLTSNVCPLPSDNLYPGEALIPC